ncbi:MAG: DoxX family protein [Phaeospirillum sp.]|nr:DoxX family protein [Phaeospirillum sp.]
MLQKIFGRFSGYSIIVLRVALGVIFIAHGGQKLFGWWGGSGLNGFADSLGQGGMPYPMLMATLAASAEFFGGIMVLFGIFARWGALFILCVMLVAIATVHAKNGFFLHNRGYEYNLALIAMSLAILFAGSGKWSVKQG